MVSHMRNQTQSMSNTTEKMQEQPQEKLEFTLPALPALPAYKIYDQCGIGGEPGALHLNRNTDNLFAIVKDDVRFSTVAPHLTCKPRINPDEQMTLCRRAQECPEDSVYCFKEQPDGATEGACVFPGEDYTDIIAQHNSKTNWCGCYPDTERFTRGSSCTHQNISCTGPSCAVKGCALSSKFISEHTAESMRDCVNQCKLVEGLCQGINKGETCQGNCYSDLVKTTNGTSSPYCLNGASSCSPPPKTCTQIMEEATQEATQSYPTLTNEDILSAAIIKEAADKCEQEGGLCKGFVVPKPELVMIEGGLGGIARS